MGKKSQLGWFEKQLRTNCIKIILRNILNTRLTTLKQKTNKELVLSLHIPKNQYK